MDNLALGNIFVGSHARRSVTIGTGAMVPTIQLPQTAKVPNLFNFEELKSGFSQALHQVRSGALALALVIRYHPTIVDFADERFAETGWQNLNGQLFGRTFDRVDLRPYKDTELSFDNTAQEVIASQLCVRAHTDKGVKEIGIGVGIALTRSGLIYPRPTFSD